MPVAAAARTMAGIDVLRAIVRGDLPAPPIAGLMDLRIAEVAEGRVVFETQPAEYHYNPIGMVHGGLACTLCDSAMGCAVQSTLPAGTGYTTLELKVNFVRPMTVTTGVVRCEAAVVSAGSRVATAEARVVDAAGRLYSHATATCLIFGPPADAG
ncbi:MAG TPA: PaaI family thioesterase [Actinomycetota bacterium]|nr:PaaI family thioesterase [Actinomycetota bacterium]